MPKLFIIAGEASGDLHGANLIHALKKESTDHLTIYGVGGDKIRATGALEFFDMAHFHANGVTAVVRQLSNFRKAFDRIVASVQKVRPDLVILIDNPGFNLRLAEKLHALGIPLVYYLTPQIWAWAPKRVHKIKKFFKKTLVAFDFEEQLFRKHNVPSVWVGHPLRDMPELKEIKPRSHETPKAGPYTVALMPGSRKSEVSHLLPEYLKTAAILSRKLNGTRFLLIQAPTLPKSFYDPMLKKSAVPIERVEKNSYEAIASSDLVLVCSGTATLECSMLRVPMIISNKGSFISYMLVRSLIRIPYLGLPNILLDGPHFPELLQYDATAEKISKEALRILTDEAVRVRMLKDLEIISKKLGEPGASQRAAKEVLRLL